MVLFTFMLDVPVGTSIWRVLELAADCVSDAEEALAERATDHKFRITGVDDTDCSCRYYIEVTGEPIVNDN